MHVRGAAPTCATGLAGSSTRTFGSRDSAEAESISVAEVLVGGRFPLPWGPGGCPSPWFVGWVSTAEGFGSIGPVHHRAAGCGRDGAGRAACYPATDPQSVGGTGRGPRCAAADQRGHADERARLGASAAGCPGHRALARVVEQRACLRAVNLDPACTEGVHSERLRKLAREGARFTAQHLRALSPLRRRATLVATVLDTITRLTDDGVALFDRAVGRMFRRAEVREQDALLRDARAINDKVRLLVKLGAALIKARDGGDDLQEAVSSAVGLGQAGAQRRQGQGGLPPARDRDGSSRRRCRLGSPKRRTGARCLPGRRRRLPSTHLALSRDRVDVPSSRLS